jgi:maltooligosyltrehalose synthase
MYVNIDYNLAHILWLIDIAQAIAYCNRITCWKEKYDYIFDMKIGKCIRDAGYNFDWYDPDCSYEDDVRAYVNALVEWKEEMLDKQITITP